MRITLPNTQTLTSTTFKSPRALLEEQAITIPELYEWSLIHNPNFPLFRYHDGENVQTITYAEAVPAVRRAAHLVKSVVESSKIDVDPVVPPIIAVLANTGMFSQIVHKFTPSFRACC